MWVAVIQRSRQKYRQCAYRYIYLDSGHIAQNLYLAATAMNLGCCAIAAFFDEEVNQIVGVDGTEETTIYLATIGKKEDRESRSEESGGLPLPSDLGALHTDFSETITSTTFYEIINPCTLPFSTATPSCRKRSTASTSFIGITGHAFNAPEQADHIGIVFVDQGQSGLQPVRLKEMELIRALLLHDFQAGFHRDRIGGIQRERSIGDCLDGLDHPGHQLIADSCGPARY